MTRKVLGRGLSALIPSRDETDRGSDLPPPARIGGGPNGAPSPVSFASVPAARRDYLTVAIEDIHPAADQPRKRFDEQALATLVDSIRKDGLLQPLLVRGRSPAEGGGFAIIAGERRWRAAGRAGLQQVPVVIREVAPRESFELALIENLQREDLNPIEEAEAYQRLLDEHGMTQEQMAERVGRDRTTITNALRLLKLPKSVRAMVEQGELSMGQARALAGLEGAKEIEQAARRAAERGLSVRQVEALVRSLKAQSAARPASAQKKSASIKDLEQRLVRRFGTPVRVIDQGGKGKIEMDWSSLDELDRLLELFLGHAQ